MDRKGKITGSLGGWRGGVGLLAILALGLLSACGGELADTGVTPTSFVEQAPAETEPAQATEAASVVGTATLEPAGETEAPVETAAPAPGESEAGTETPTETGGEAGLPAPDCSSPAQAAPSMTEGPYYKEGSPERTSLLEEGTPGTRLLLQGYVLTTDCQPVAGAWLDFWQTDGNGNYDNAGYGMRGHQFTDENGWYMLETVIPGFYPGRTAHIHVKVQAPGGAVLTTQLFFPGVSGNETDAIFSELLLVEVEEVEGGVSGRFDFVVP